MVNVEISRDVPVPPPKRRYPYRDMEIGESFLVTDGVLQVVCNNNYRTGKKLERKFIARKELEGSEGMENKVNGHDHTMMPLAMEDVKKAYMERVYAMNHAELFHELMRVHTREC
jgi:hypothetical protein